MSAAGTFSLDTNTYLTAGSAVSTFSAGTTGFTPSTATSGAVVLSGTLNVANGGTGTTSLATLAANSAFSSLYQGLNTNLTSLSGLTYASLSFVKMSAAGTFSLDTNTYLTSGGAVTSFSGGTTGFTPSTATSGAITLSGILNVSNGGTGYSSLTSLAGNTAFTSVYVPYTGATTSVNIGSNSFTGGAASFTTGAFSGLINSTGGNNSIVLSSSTATTGYSISQFLNTNGSLYYGVDKSTGGGIFTGTAAYAAAIGTGTNTSLQFATNNTVRYTIDGSGNNTWTGRCNVNGATDNSAYALNTSGVVQAVTTAVYSLNTSYFTEILSNSLTGSSSITNSSEVTMSSGLDAFAITTSGTNTLITASLVAATISRMYVNGTGGSWTRVAAWSGNIEVGGGTSITDAACLYTGVPYQQTGQTAYSGTITNYYGLLIEDISTNTNISAKITNKYGIYQRGASDINFFNGAIQLGTGNALTASVLSTVTNKIKIIVNGTTLYILASTSST